MKDFVVQYKSGKRYYIIALYVLIVLVMSLLCYFINRLWLGADVALFIPDAIVGGFAGFILADMLLGGTEGGQHRYNMMVRNTNGNWVVYEPSLWDDVHNNVRKLVK